MRQKQHNNAFLQRIFYEKIIELAYNDRYDQAQFFLAETYRMGYYNEKNWEKAFEIYEFALQSNNSHHAATMIALMHWAGGNFEEAKKFCFIAKSIPIVGNLDTEAIDRTIEDLCLHGY